MKSGMFILSALFAIVSNVSSRAEEDGLIATMDDLRFAQPKEKGTTELVEGKIGKAVRFRFDKEARSTFFNSNIHGTPEWDRVAGFSIREDREFYPV